MRPKEQISQLSLALRIIIRMFMGILAITLEWSYKVPFQYAVSNVLAILFWWMLLAISANLIRSAFAKSTSTTALIREMCWANSVCAVYAAALWFTNQF
jgi:hypothetical protein